MLAVGLSECGAPGVLSVIEAEEPAAEPGNVVVRVVAATVNPADTLMRAGRQASSMTHLTPPYVPGMEFAGYVHDVDDRSRLRVGQRVMGAVNPRRPGGGAHAQYISVPIASVAPIPDAVDIAEAATVPMNGLTAKMALEALGLRSGDTLLVTGGAGAVGGYAIQLATRAGLAVIADAEGADVVLLRGMGASEIVPRGNSMDAAVRALRPDGVDGAIDAALLGERAAALVRDGGGFVTLRSTHAIEEPRLHHRYVAVMDEMENADALAWLAERLADGTLTPRVAVRLPMSAAAEAHRLVEQGGLRGRVVLMFGREGSG